MIFDATLALERLDQLFEKQEPNQVVPAKNDLKDLVETFQQELGRLLSPFEIEDLEKSLKEDGTSADLIKEALREAVLNGKPNWKYIQAILRNWRHEGIKSVVQVEAKRQEREATKSSKCSSFCRFSKCYGSLERPILSIDNRKKCLQARKKI